MDTLLVYLVKASGILALFLGVYHIFLKKETFFEANRHFLLAGILAAFAFPFLEITRYVTVEQPVWADLNAVPITVNNEVTFSSVSWGAILMGIYGLGVLFLIGKFLLQLLSLRKLLRKHEVRVSGAYRLVETDQDLAPFSFFNYIFYNPSQFNKEELQAIRQHEEAHCAQKHSIDVMVGHLLTIALWINPLSWLYRNTMQQNLEFLADFSAVSQTKSVKNYQYALLKVSSNPIHTPITNNFYNSLIKKRIVMLHKSRSKQLNAFKFALILPLLAGFVFAFNTKVVAQEKNVVVEVQIERIEIKIDKDYTKEQMESDTKFMKEQGIDLKFKGVKRNASGEITAINASYKDGKGVSGNYSQNSDDGIDPFSFRVTGEGEDRSIGFFSGDSLHESHTISNSISANKIVVKMDDNEIHRGKNKKHKVVRIEGGEETSTWVESGDGEEMEVLVEIKDGEKVIKINGEEVSEEELDKSGGKFFKVKKAKKDKEGNVFIIKDSDDDYDIEVIEEESGGFIFVDNDKDREPLFIVDGKEMDQGIFNTITKPDQIEKIEVIKGDKAVEEYGVKGKNGVIVVTTIKGKE